MTRQGWGGWRNVAILRFCFGCSRWRTVGHFRPKALRCNNCRLVGPAIHPRQRVGWRLTERGRQELAS